MTRPGANLPQLAIESADELFEWLAKNHDTAESHWLVTWKKGDPRYVPRRAILDALIAWGWIDSLPRKLDAARTQLLISRRKPGSNWSMVNRDIVAALEVQGRMAPPGRAAVRAAQADGSWAALDAVEMLAEPADLAAALDETAQARANWDRFPPSSRRGILEWIASARRDETRARRIAETVAKAAENRKANFPAGRDMGPARTA